MAFIKCLWHISQCVVLDDGAVNGVWWVVGHGVVCMWCVVGHGAGRCWCVVWCVVVYGGVWCGVCVACGGAR